MTATLPRAQLYFPSILCLAALLIVSLSPSPHTGAQMVPGCAPVINEILTGTAATGTEEFVELFNHCATAINVDGWRLVYRSATNTAPVTLGEGAPLVALQGIMPPGGYLVFGGPGYHGPSNGSLQGGIAPSGAIGLRDRDLRLVDSVGFGQVSGNAFVEGTPASAPPVSPPPGLSLSRFPNGVDNNNNGGDFTVAPPTPMGANMRLGAGPATTPPSAPLTGAMAAPSGPSPPSAAQTVPPFPDSGGLLYACLNPSGQLRAVGPNTACAAGEMRIHWLVAPDSSKP